jgi:hypothetical protein
LKGRRQPQLPRRLEVRLRLELPLPVRDLPPPGWVRLERAQQAQPGQQAQRGLVLLAQARNCCR